MESIRPNNRRYVIKSADIVSILLAVVPVLNIYMTPIPILTLGEIVMFILAGILLTTKKPINYLVCHNRILIFTIYGLIVTFVSTIINFSIIKELPYKETIAFIVYIVLLFILGKRIDIKNFIYYYEKIAYIFAIFLIFQFLVHLVTGRWIPGLIPGIESSYGRSTTLLIQRMERASSVFKEPAHYAQYVAIPFITTLFRPNRKIQDNIKIVVYTLSLAFTVSGNGLLVIAVTGAMYIIHIGKTKGLVRGVALLLLLAIIFVYLANTNKAFVSLLGRVTEIQGTNAARYSGYIRVLRGYLVFWSFNLLAKIFGIGIGLYGDYSLHYAFEALTSRTFLELDYINGFQYYLVSTGLIGVLMYTSLFVYSFKNREDAVKCISLVFLVLILISGMYRGPAWLFFMIIMLSLPEGENTIY